MWDIIDPSQSKENVDQRRLQAKKLNVIRNGNHQYFSYLTATVHKSMFPGLLLTNICLLKNRKKSEKKKKTTTVAKWLER